MAELAIGLATAFWLGFLTSISPCPLATNIAAISYIGQKMSSPKKVLSAGLLYTAGRAATYLVLGVLLTASLLSAPGLSHVLQKYMNQALGPILILVGMILLDLITIPVGSGGFGERLRKKAETFGLAGALLLGVLFALSFCPISAVLFFGSLIPLAVKQQSGVLYPAVYGIATGLPVMVFAFLIALGAGKVAQVYDRMRSFEFWARRITGILFIGVGIYFCLVYIFGVF